MTLIYSRGKTPINGFYVDHVETRRKARVLGAPIETGFVTFDDKVIDPSEVVVTGRINTLEENYKITMNTLSEMLEARNFSDCRFMIMVDDVVQSNLILMDWKNVADKDNPDILNSTLTYVEAMLVQSSGSSPNDPSHGPTQNTGRVSA